MHWGVINVKTASLLLGLFNSLETEGKTSFYLSHCMRWKSLFNITELCFFSSGKKKIRENQSFPWIRIFYLDSVLIRSWASHLVRMCVTVKKWKKGSLNHNVGLQQSRALQSIQIFYEQKRDWCHYHLLDLTSATKNIYLPYSICVQNLYESHRVELPAHFVMHSIHSIPKQSK